MPSRDHPRSLDEPPIHAVRRALRWSQASIVWGAMASSIAIASGVAAGSLLLIAFGAVGLLDVTGSVLLVVHFRHAARHQQLSPMRERRALVAIAAGMGVIAVATLVESAHRLVGHHTANASSVGMAIASASVVALAILAGGKQRTGARLRSRALVADGHVSAMGACFGAFTVGGTLTTTTFDWWWIDPAGSVAVALVALVIAVRHATA